MVERTFNVRELVAAAAVAFVVAVAAVAFGVPARDVAFGVAAVAVLLGVVVVVTGGPKPKPTTIDDLPNDLLVSIFLATEAPNWTRRTVPLVCKRWAELYRSKGASPLHTVVDVVFAKGGVEGAGAVVPASRDPAVAGAPRRRPVVHASRVISWAERRAGSVRKLGLFTSDGEAFEDFSATSPASSPFEDFSPEDLGRLVAVVGSSLTEVIINLGFRELVQKPFWESLRDFVVPAGRLRQLRVLDATPSESDIEPLGQLAGSLEDLALASVDSARVRGPLRFPESLCALKKLKRLSLFSHPRIGAIPAEISSLKELELLDLPDCGLSSLPKELGELSALESLNLSFNYNLANNAFPAELGKLKSLKDLNLTCCGLRAVPAFVGELESLEVLNVNWNREEICASLDFLIEGCPRLREVRIEAGLFHGNPHRPPRWSPESLPHLEAFKAELLAKNPSAKVIY